MAIDIQELFSSILPDPAKADRQAGVDAANVVGQLGGVAALQAPALSRQLRRGVGQALSPFGIDLSTPAEKLRESLKGADTTTAQGREEVLEMIRQVNPTGAIQLRAAFEEQARAQQQVDAQTASAAASGVSAQAATVNAAANLQRAQNEAASLNAADPNKDRFKVAAGNVFDTKTSEWLTPPSDTMGPLEIEKLDPDAYDSKSFNRYLSAVASATIPQEQRDALDLLLPLPKDDWNWVAAEGTDNQGNPRFVQKPVGEALQVVSNEVRTANSSGRTQRRKAGDVIDVLADMQQAIESGDASTEIKGMLFSLIPGTNNYTFDADLDTIKANLGINALQEARNNSANGASGFGQLTERELARLEALIASIETGMTKEDLLVRMKRVEDDFTRARDEAKSDWTIDQWLGIELPPEDGEEVFEVTF